MRPHSASYQNMNVIMVGRAEYTVILEEMAIEYARERFGDKVDNHPSYRTGPYVNKEVMFLYLVFVIKWVELTIFSTHSLGLLNDFSKLIL